VALRQACTSLPHKTLVPEIPIDPKRPAPLVRPYAAEEDICSLATDPEHFMEGYAWPMGLLGGGLTLLTFTFFALVGGLLRVLWYGPLNRLLADRWSRG